MKAKIILFSFLISFSVAIFGPQILAHKPLLFIFLICLSCLLSYKTVSNFNIPIIKSFKYFLWLIKEISYSTMNVTKLAWQPEINLQSCMNWINTNQTTERGLFIYANSITLTPGTITVEVDNNKLLIHGLDDANIKDLENHFMDNKIMEIM